MTSIPITFSQHAQKYSTTLKLRKSYRFSDDASTTFIKCSLHDRVICTGQIHPNVERLKPTDSPFFNMLIDVRDINSSLDYIFLLSQAGSFVHSSLPLAKAPSLQQPVKRRYPIFTKLIPNQAINRKLFHTSLSRF